MVTCIQAETCSQKQKKIRFINNLTLDRYVPIFVEFYSKNIFKKLVHLVGFIIRIYHDARSSERQSLTFPSRNNVQIMIFRTPLLREILFAVRCFHFLVNIVVTSLLLFTCVFVRWFRSYYNLFKIIHVVSSVKFTFILLQRLLTEDCPEHLTVEAEVRPQTSPYTIYFGQSLLGQDRFLCGYFGFPVSVSFEHCSMIIQSPWPLQNSGNRQRS